MDKESLGRALELSRQSVLSGGFPVGAVVVLNNENIGEGISDGKRLKDATSHAEIAAIREAEKKIGSRYLQGAVLYSSLEPCVMCFSAAYWAGVSKVVFVCRKEKVSAVHYEGASDIREINDKNNRRIEIVHSPEWEKQASEVIDKWERART